MAFDDSLSLLIIGTHSGQLKAYGSPGVVYCGEHHDDMSVLQILCHGVKRQVVTQCLDNYLYLWRLQDENDRPEISMVNKYRLASARFEFLLICVGYVNCLVV
jgi:lethal(2) giant larvae protein